MSDVRPATHDDLDLVTSIMAEGFYDDPVMRWALDDDATRLGKLLRMFGGLVGGTLGGRGAVHLASDVATALWWEPDLRPDRRPTVPEDEHESPGPSNKPEPSTEATEVSESTKAAASEATEAEEEPLWTPAEAARFENLNAGQHEVHPEQPHWYLHVVSTLPPHRGRGLGAAVLAPVLARADDGGMPCYLESTNPRNRSLYRRLGFEDLAPVPYDGPDMLAMWREPR